MKQGLLIASVASLLFCSSNANAISVNVGNPLTLSFSTMDLISQNNNYNGNPIPNQWQFSLQTSGDNLSSPDKIQVELFENTNLTGSTLLSGYQYRPADGTSTVFATTQLTYNNQWQDLNGSVRVSMLTGSIDISSLILSVFLNGDFYSTQNLIAATIIPPVTPTNPPSNDEEDNINAVPLPASLPLMLSALAGFIGLRRKF